MTDPINSISDSLRNYYFPIYCISILSATRLFSVNVVTTRTLASNVTPKQPVSSSTLQPRQTVHQCLSPPPRSISQCSLGVNT